MHPIKAALSVTALLALTAPALAQEVNLYSSRHYDSDDALYERREVACASYRSSMGAIRTGLQRDYLATLPESYDTFRTDMETWLPGMAFDKAIELGSLETYHAACVAQIDRAQEMIASRAPELKVEEEDYSCGF